MTDLDFNKLNRELNESADARNIREAQPMSFDEFFPSIYGKILQRYMEKADEVKDLDYYFDLDCKGPTLFIRRLIRRMNKFLFFENFANQKKYNSIMQDSNMLLYSHIRRLEKLLNRNMQVIQSLEARIRKLEGNA